MSNISYKVEVRYDADSEFPILDRDRVLSKSISDYPVVTVCIRKDHHTFITKLDGIYYYLQPSFDTSPDYYPQEFREDEVHVPGSYELCKAKLQPRDPVYLVADGELADLSDITMNQIFERLDEYLMEALL